MRLILLDGDMLAYRYAAALEESSTIDWGGGVVSHLDKSGTAYRRMTRWIEDLSNNYEADKVIVTVSDKDNFRIHLNTGYKENRNDKARPPLLGDLKKYLVEEHGAIIMPGLEADDVMGIYATDPEIEAEWEPLIVTIDKDLKQIRGRHVNPFPYPGKEDGADVVVKPPDDDWMFYYQVLIGDSIDGYKGCPGIGPKKADKILDDVFHEHTGSSVEELNKAWWAAVVATYEKKNLTEDDAIAQARMSRILRFGEWCVEKGPTLWTPLSN